MESTAVETQSYEVAVEKLVNWWVKKSFNTLLNQDNGDKSEMGGLGFMLSNMLSMNAQKEVTPEKIELFKSSLTNSLLNYSYNYVTLGTDYHPDKMLADACEFAGISTACIPIKTGTWIEKTNGNKVTVSFGYGGKREVI